VTTDAEAYPNLTPEQIAEYRREARQLPPLTDEQLDALCDTLASIPAAQ
jgi:hypothetical protein